MSTDPKGPRASRSSARRRTSTSWSVPEARLGETLAEATERLRAAGAETPRLDAEGRLAHVLRTDRTGVLAHPEAPLGPAQRTAFAEALERREHGEPVAYIRGLKEFYGL